MAGAAGRTVVVAATAVVGVHTRIAPPVRIGEAACIGLDPQDFKYGGRRTDLVVGPGCEFGPAVSVHRGTEVGGGVTVVGRLARLERGSHVGHDCVLGAGVSVGERACLAGHCEIADGATIGAAAGVLQRVAIGRAAVVRPGAAVDRDVVPYSIVAGNRAVMVGFAAAALPDPADRAVLAELFLSSTSALADRAAMLLRRCAAGPLPSPAVGEILRFTATHARAARPICLPPAAAETLRYIDDGLFMG